MNYLKIWRHIYLRDLSSPAKCFCCIFKWLFRGWRCSSVVEHFHCLCAVLGFIPGIAPPPKKGAFQIKKIFVVNKSFFFIFGGLLHFCWESSRQYLGGSSVLGIKPETLCMPELHSNPLSCFPSSKIFVVIFLNMNYVVRLILSRNFFQRCRALGWLEILN